MIHAEYSISCDGCGLYGASSDLSPIDAQLRVQADGWTSSPDETQHWCPACTDARKES